jgi:hypothetical protein
LDLLSCMGGFKTLFKQALTGQVTSRLDLIFPGFCWRSTQGESLS